MSLNLKKLSRVELNNSMKYIFKKECEVLTAAIHHIAEIETRKIYLDYAYPSLFEYLTKHIGYSAGSAQRRIDAARLSREVPEVLEIIEKGSFSLAQVSLVKRSERQAHSENREVTSEIKHQLVAELENKSFLESEILVKKTFNIQVATSQKISHQKDESVRFEITLTKAQWQKLNKMRELLSHSLPHGSWDQILEFVSDQVIRQKDKTRLTKSASKTDRTLESDSESDSNLSTKNEVKDQSPKSNFQQGVAIHKHRSHIPMPVQREIFIRDRCCQFIDKLTGTKCNATWQLTLDHIQPLWSGGANSKTNLRVLCARHNREIYRFQAGLRAQL